MAKILVVDDETDLEALVKQKFRKQIRDQLYEFIFAINGKHALEQLEAHKDIDIVLSDINMPEMDGLTLLSKLNEQNTLLKSVIVSAYGDMDNIRTAMNRGAFDFITKPVDFKDLEITMEKTLRHVEHMRQTLQAIKENNILKMYVDEAVLNFMGSREFENALTINETVEATVAFIDLCKFTTFAERESPDTVIKVLNSYFDIMVKEILAQGGFVDKFIGDAIMAVFRGDYHLDRAIEAALAIRKHIEMLPPFQGAVEFVPNLSIGVNNGDVVSGNIGSVALKRLDYTVIGDTVNTAQRFESVAEEGQIIISAAAYEQVRESFKCRKVGDVELKHKSTPVVIYEVLE